MLFNQQNKIFFQCNSLCFPNTSPTFERQQNKRYCFQILIKHLLIFVQRLPYVVHPMSTIGQRYNGLLSLAQHIYNHAICDIAKQLNDIKL